MNMEITDNRAILAIETSGEMCSTSVYYNDNRYSEINLMLKHVHSERLLEVIDQALRAVKLSLNEIRAIAISSGPGSFTGLRIGMSATKGLAIGAGLPVIAVPTFDALALQISSYLPDNSKFIIANKVNLEEIYYSKYVKTEGSFSQIEALQVIKREDLDQKIDKDTLLFGNVIKKENVRQVSSPEASIIAKWAYLFGKDLLTYDYDFLEPTYLKNFVIR